MKYIILGIKGKDKTNVCIQPYKRGKCSYEIRSI